MTNLKLQKTMYFMYGYLLNKYPSKFEKNFPVFSKWDYGPVCENVYYTIKKINLFNKWEDPNFISLSEFEKEVDAAIMNNFIAFDKEFNLDSDDLIFIKKLILVDPFKLVEVSHQTKPWIEAKNSEVIDDKKIRDFFKTYDFSIFDTMSLN